ncbi:hypothetical protein NE237_009081 [Protea cynaroides]|uniref:Secreted protein n=1 Tax=Protea cynaroides TaxID=273540 RepID=A0A9Q0KXN0_9MAGN|nr:hypothetical protein NE237_009081 [Protea cynaroides]
MGHDSLKRRCWSFPCWLILLLLSFTVQQLIGKGCGMDDNEVKYILKLSKFSAQQWGFRECAAERTDRPCKMVMMSERGSTEGTELCFIFH